MSSPVVFSLTGPQRDCLAALALVPAAWLNFGKPVRLALHRMGLTSAVIRPALTVEGWRAAELALALVGRASLRSEQRAEKSLYPHARENCVGLAHVAAGLAHTNEQGK